MSFMSNVHPEMNDGPIGDLMKEIGASETVDVWCKTCKDWRKMNAAYAKIIGTGEIESCSICRAKK